MDFRHYQTDDYEAVCDFLIELNRDDRNHINWNWARFEWMAEHPEFDKSAVASIGLWVEDEKIVGAAIYDMYFGEAFCGAQKGYEALYPAMLDYAYRELKDDAGLGIAICDDCAGEIKAARNAGFEPAEQTETIMKRGLDEEIPVVLPPELRIKEMDPAKEPDEFQWVLWQGFDHGMDRDQFEKAEEIVPQIRRHLDPRLSVASVDQNGDAVAYCCLWYSEKTDYAYVEPVCAIPTYRGWGVAKALVCEALNRAKALGAKAAYVISDSTFYQKLGFEKDKHFTFYWKE